MTAEKIKSFTQLAAWRKSHLLVLAVFEVCTKMQVSDSLRKQMERAVLSITSNIAEGFGRQSAKDKKHFYVMARGSAFEIQNQLLVARDTRRIGNDQFENLAKLSLESICLIHSLIRSTDRPAVKSSLLVISY